MLKLKPEDTINYLRTRLVKENKIRTEINLRNNNLFKNISLYNTLNKLNITSLPNDNKYNSLKYKQSYSQFFTKFHWVMKCSETA